MLQRFVVMRAAEAGFWQAQSVKAAPARARSTASSVLGRVEMSMQPKSSQRRYSRSFPAQMSVLNCPCSGQALSMYIPSARSTMSAYTVRRQWGQTLFVL